MQKFWHLGPGSPYLGTIQGTLHLLPPGGEAGLVSQVQEETDEPSPMRGARNAAPCLEQALCISITLMGPHAPAGEAHPDQEWERLPEEATA